MNIGLIGSGGREHALCLKLFQSNSPKKIFCFPGNAGTANIATNIEVDILDFNKVFKLIKFYKIDIVIIGPEEPLVKGLVNFLNKKKVKVFGPNKYASKLEGSKAFMKNLCKANKIPTANFKICSSINHVKDFLKTSNFPIVVKADGLAAGKGVTICKNKRTVLDISDEIFKGKFKSSKKVVLEEFLMGEEASYFLVVDRNSFKFFGSAQDHKRVGEKDRGPNTGGMGAYSPAPIVNKVVENKIIERIVKPTLNALKKKKQSYKGFLYVGLMIKNNEPKLIEFNVRFGDPECQVLMMRLKNDILDLFISSINKKLGNKKISWDKKPAITVVAASKGYPGKFKLNEEIKKINEIQNNKNQQLFHSGTISDHKGRIFNSGGRVLNSTVKSTSLKKARKTAIGLLNKIKWKNKYFRRDIGYRVINK